LKFLYLERTPSSPKNRFGFSWFFPAIKKHKVTLLQVVVASFFVQLLALFNPLLIQQIIDAVINQGNISSLNVLGTLLIAMALAQGLLSSLRTYLFSDTSNRIDLSLGGKIINHLLRLPSAYFSKRTVGETSSRISELEKIREFLTGTALTLVLDVVFSIIYIAVMMIYSIQLTFVALAVIPFFVLITLSVSPIIRRQIREKNIANANLQSHMVETISSVDTIKGQGIEIPSEWKWGQLYGKQMKAGFRNTLTKSISGSASNFLSQLSGLLVIWAGAVLVLQGKLTIGQLIAFRILSGYVTGPILRLTTMSQNFQETALSLERISDIIDNPQEIEIIGKDLPPMPPIDGKVSFENINFKFSDRSKLILKNINFQIPSGSFVGVVGESGSGKSTLLKLINQILIPTNGIIRIDDFDISKVNLYSYRSQIGVVPQDSILFKGTVQQNIALAKPEADFDEISKAAKLADAHDFIQKLTSGYSTEVGERGANLSGGQRQRIAMARMFLQSPKLLLLDEATSSLDIKSEKKILKNLLNISDKKTVIFISHRLNNFIEADQIFYLYNGTIVERGSHKELMSLSGRYKVLFDERGK
jgi:ATP-binding cassette subfamily B protein